MTETATQRLMWLITRVVGGTCGCLLLLPGCASFSDRDHQPLGPVVPRIADQPSPISRQAERAAATKPDALQPTAVQEPVVLPPVVTPLDGERPRPSQSGEKPAEQPAVIRGQSPPPRALPSSAAPPSVAASGAAQAGPPQGLLQSWMNSATPGNGDYFRYGMKASGQVIARGQDAGTPSFQPLAPPGAAPTPMFNGPNDITPIQPNPWGGPGGGTAGLPPVNVDVNVEEARTGRFMFGAGVNSDLGVTGQIVIDERNFDPLRPPTSWDDVINGTAWRGAGQGLRLEAMPGSQVQRYLGTYTMPYVYLLGIPEPFVLNTSAFYYTRSFFDWNEQRLGGRLSLGYRVTPDLSLTGAIRAEEVKIFDPRVVGLVPQLDQVVGDNELYSGRISLAHDTRDNAFLATQGHFLELSFEQAFGTFDYPRGELDYRQYFLMRERPDGSGRHTLAYSFRLGASGSQTPIFENYFSGGYSTMRGFDFRGASPVGPAGVALGGQFRFLGSVEYFFPLTADDMIKGVVFCDFGTTEEEIQIHADNYRVAPGFGLRLNIPAMGPAPLALDLAVPIARAPTDDIQNFSFFFGFSR